VAEKAGSCEVLQAVRSNDEAKDDRWEVRGYGDLLEERVLRQEVHGSGDGRENQSPEHAQHASSITEGREIEVRNLRREQSPPPCPPQRRERNEQLCRQFDYIVRALPSSLAFAQLHGLRNEEEALCDLRQAILQEGILPEAPTKIQEVWQSISDEAKTRIAIHFSGRAGIAVPVSPLAYGIPVKLGPSLAPLRHLAKDARRNRVGRLRAYGNAIVPQLATEFIKAYMESIY